MIYIDNNEGKKFALYGNIIFASAFGILETHENSYIICDGENVAGIFDTLPTEYKDIKILDYKDKIIIPGLIDLHIHAPQFAFRGMGTDLELLQWLETYTFPEESKYSDLKYAKQAYSTFAQALTSSFTTRAVIFGTVHCAATLLLAELLEESGLCTLVGKVNMDMNCPDGLREDTDASLADTEYFINECTRRFKQTHPIITPRFAPSCSSRLMEGLGELAERYGLPVQSHLSENTSEIQWVQSLFPESACYSDVYYKHGLLGDKTIMAHCVYPTETDTGIMTRSKTIVAHCPCSNLNLASGIAPVRRLINMGVTVGLGTDVAGGLSISMMKAVSDAMQMSKLYWLLNDKSDRFLTVAEAFSLATICGGAIFGEAVGSFIPGSKFDALVINDERLGVTDGVPLFRRLERIIHLATFKHIDAKFVNGRKIL